MGLEKCYNYKKINDKISTSGVVPKHVLDSVANENIEVIINLLPDNHKKSMSCEKEIIEAQGIMYLNIPVEFGAPKHEAIEKFIVELRKIGDKKVHIHCAANWRVSAFYGIYAFKSGMWRKDEAKSFISSIWNPVEFPVWNSFLEHYGLGMIDN